MKSSMKKTIVAALIAVVAATGLFATQKSVTVLGNVEVKEPELALYYEDGKKSVKVNGGENIGENKIGKGATAWDLSKTDLAATSDFVVRYTGNTKSTQNLSVEVTAEAFTNKDNRDNTETIPVYVSCTKGTPTEGQGTAHMTATNSVKADKLNTNLAVFTFNLYWNGRADLAAGAYQSAVSITYSVN